MRPRQGTRMVDASEVARLIRSPGLSTAAEYAYASVVASGSRLIFAAGACPLDQEGVTVGVGDVRAQAAQAMGNLRVSLADAGARLKTWSAQPSTSPPRSSVTSSRPGRWFVMLSRHTTHRALCSASSRWGTTTSSSRSTLSLHCPVDVEGPGGATHVPAIDRSAGSHHGRESSHAVRTPSSSVAAAVIATWSWAGSSPRRAITACA